MAVMLGMHVQSITPSIIDSPEEAPVVAGAAVVVGGAVVVGATSVAKGQKFFWHYFVSTYNLRRLSSLACACLSWVGMSHQHSSLPPSN